MKKTFHMKCAGPKKHKFTLTENEVALIDKDDIPMCPKCMMPAFVVSVKVRAR